MREPRDVYRWSRRQYWAGDRREHFVAILLDGRHRRLASVVVHVGSMGASLVHPREVFAPAVRMGASGLIVVHNHPSGDPTPSVEDVSVTERLWRGGQLLGIPLLDHVVVGRESYCALGDRIERWKRNGGPA